MGTNKAAYQQYMKSKILTASPAELTLLLYDGFIKFCNIAINSIKKEDYYEANKNIQKAERIIGEFKITLNHKYPVAENFDNIYDYVLKRLHDGNIKKDISILKECITHIKSLRETWKQVMEKTKEKIIKEKK